MIAIVKCSTSPSFLLLPEYEDDIQFADTTPKNSLPARSLFNLEGLGLSLSAEEQQARFIKAMGYVGKLVNRGEERQENGQVIGPSKIVFKNCCLLQSPATRQGSAIELQTLCLCSSEIVRRRTYKTCFHNAWK